MVEMERNIFPLSHSNTRHVGRDLLFRMTRRDSNLLVTFASAYSSPSTIHLASSTVVLLPRSLHILDIHCLGCWPECEEHEVPHRMHCPLTNRFRFTQAFGNTLFIQSMCFGPCSSRSAQFQHPSVSLGRTFRRAKGYRWFVVRSCILCFLSLVLHACMNSTDHP